ncbi:hypothetical protein [Paraglaciecola psychrophila]|uniref:hypothetical protein n=1 Tax=Paraglaciecola psychrophila TaxID=326544 RepID=UPI000291457C|nr:hypothetical protein [Paraglaciecola psychrophila]GAC38956.1 hypothetical protein GPSY_3345 [Paraglaciecola psychrophila 170]
MKILALTSMILLISGCTKNEIKHRLLHPNASTNNPIKAAIYVGSALVVGELSEDCSHGHPEDREKCRKAKKNLKTTE